MKRFLVLGLALFAGISCSSGTDKSAVAIGTDAGFGGQAASGAAGQSGTGVAGTVSSSGVAGASGGMAVAGANAAAGTGMQSSVAGTGTAAAGAGGAAAGSGGAAAGSGGAAGLGVAGQSGSAAGGAGGSAGQGGTGGAAGQAGGMATAGTSSPPAKGKKFVGNITTRGQVRTDFAMYWDQITPENEGKWGSVEPQRDQMNWAPLDRIHDYAVANNIVFKQHTFVWGSQQPSWLNGLSASEQRAEVEEWIRLFCERYPDVALIDVVNEPPPHTTPVYMNALGGAGSSGYDWIVQAFKWARQYCPGAILILNDYNTIEYGNDNSHFIDIVNRIKSAGAPIDAIGAQAHAAYKLQAGTVKGFIDKLAATGLPIYITEYDIDLANDSQQRMVMSTQFPMFWEDEHIAGITLWGYVVGATWVPNSGLLNTNGTPRPALTWLLDFLKR